MDPRNNAPREPRKEDADDTYLPDMTPRRVGGGDSLAESSPFDSNSDEKVIINEQRENKRVNTPSQTAVNTGKATSSDEEVL